MINTVSILDNFFYFRQKRHLDKFLCLKWMESQLHNLKLLQASWGKDLVSQPSGGSRIVIILILVILSQKLHKIEKNWAEKEGCVRGFLTSPP